MKPGPKRIEIDLKEIERLAGLGLTEQEICSSLGFSDETLRRRKLQHVEFVEAIKRGKAKAHQEVSNWLYELCREKNFGAIVWYEKTRCGISERIHVVQEGPPRLAPDNPDTIANFAPRSVESGYLNGETQMPGHGEKMGKDGTGGGHGSHSSI